MGTSRYVVKGEKVFPNITGDFCRNWWITSGRKGRMQLTGLKLPQYRDAYTNGNNAQNFGVRFLTLQSSCWY